MAEFIPVLAAAQLPANGFKAVEVGEHSILVGRVNGHLFACLDRCPHAAAPLRIGKLVGEELMCAWHGWVFNVLDGRSVPDNQAFALTTFPVKLDGDQVCVAIPEQNNVL